MNREGAETFLRLLAEAELRDPALLSPPALPSRDVPFVAMPVALSRAAWALTVVGALDLETAEAVLDDAELALAARYGPELTEAGVIGSAGWAAGPTGPHRFASARLMIRAGRRAPRAAAAAPAEPRGGPDRYVPVGLMILFHDQTISGELNVMSYAHTASGARLVATWQARDPLGSRRRGLPPVDRFSVTDDRGQRYDLLFAEKGRPEATCDLALSPDPPPDIRWLDISAPGEQAVRVDLDGAAGLPAPRSATLTSAPASTC